MATLGGHRGMNLAIAAPGYSEPWLQWTLAIVALGYTGPEPCQLIQK